jgi:uncharacterized protein YecE (DUF72 family)
MIKVGCCGFTKGMESYFKSFNLVEVQKTFYDLPKLETAEKWRKKAPEDFEFSLKAWQLITHPPTSPTYKKARIKVDNEDKERYGFFKLTDEVLNAWDETRKICKALNTRVVVFQCPKSFKPIERNIQNMITFFQSIDRDNLILAWEPRGEWNSDIVRELCDKLELVHCVDPLLNLPSIKTNILYFRLHGAYKNNRINYKHQYTDEELQRLSKICKEIRSEEIYVLFNNVYMDEDAKRFSRIIYH